MQQRPHDPQRDRQIRVFVSSTFRDMQADRDVLVKKVFPQLRKLCESRAVTWTEVDLRWGITSEQQAEGKVLPYCLAEIERSRPFFIGLLGERYGWVPEKIPAELLKEQPWLKEHLEHSVTELEILHGVLNNPAMADRALFYFRDPAYAAAVPAQKREDFVESGPDAERLWNKLSDLKKRISNAAEQKKIKYPPREDYPNPDALAALVLADFTRIIDELYPADQVPDPLDQEAARHEQHARSRRELYVPRPRYYELLDEHVAGDGPPLVLTGESGCGKTALLANWVDRWRQSHPNDLVIQHYIGSTPDSADWMRLVTRLLGELKRAFNLADELPSTPDKLRVALDDWFIKTAGGQRIVLVLDGLNQLEDRDDARSLGWLPRVIPRNVRVLASTLPGKALDAVQERNWPTRQVELLNADERSHIVCEYLALAGKTAQREMLEAIERQPQTLNPLYLRVFLDEIRQFGRYEKLTERVRWYLDAPDPRQLYQRVIIRLENDFEEEGSDLVGDCLSLIWAARRGLSENELLELLGKDGQPLLRAKWTPFFLAIGNHLIYRGGQLNFAHEYFREAVREAYVPGAEHQHTARLRLVSHFERSADPTDREIEELPWLLQQAQEWERLKDYLAGIPIFMAMWRDEAWKWELLRYWATLRQWFSAADAYARALDRYNVADASHMAVVLNELARFHLEAGNYSAAEPLMRRVLAIDEDNFGKDHPIVATDLHNLASLLQDTNRLSEAEPLYRRALAINEQRFGKDHPRVASSLNGLASLLHDTNRLGEAEPLMWRALAIDENNLGKDHPNVALRLNNLAQLLRSANRLPEAEPLMCRALAIEEQSLGRDHPTFARHLNNLALLLYAANRLPEAEPLYRRALAIHENSLGQEHPDVARDLNNLATLLLAEKRVLEAEPLVRRVLTIYEKVFGGKHPNVAVALNNVASVLVSTNHPSEAEQLLQRALVIDEQSFGRNHPNVVRDLNNLAQVLQAGNRLSEAEPLMRRAVEVLVGCAQSTGHEHPDLQRILGNYAGLLGAMGSTEGQVYQRINEVLAPFGMSLGG